MCCPSISSPQSPNPEIHFPQCHYGESCYLKSCPAKYWPAKLKDWSKLVGTPCNSVVVDSSSNLQFLYFLERKNPQSRKKCTILKPLKRWLNLLFEKKSLISSKKLGWRKSKKSKSVKILIKYSIYRFCIKQLWRILELLNKFYKRKNSICKANKKVRICRTFDKNSANIKSKAMVAIVHHYE